MSILQIYILYVESLKSVKIASFVPKLTNGKRPVRLGQLEEKLKNLVGVFPITNVKFESRYSETGRFVNKKQSLS